VDERLDAIRAFREELGTDRVHLRKAVDNARLRSEAVIMDAAATVERCRSAQQRRAATPIAHRSCHPEETNNGTA
jgi:hypothetical protein